MYATILVAIAAAIGQGAYERTNRKDADADARQLAAWRRVIDRDAAAELPAPAAPTERERKRAAYLAAKERWRAAAGKSRPAKSAADPTPELFRAAADLADYGDVVRATFEIVQILPGDALLVRETIFAERLPDMSGKFNPRIFERSAADQPMVMETERVDNDFLLEGAGTRDAAARPGSTVAALVWLANKGTYRTVTDAPRTLAILRAVPGTIRFAVGQN